MKALRRTGSITSSINTLVNVFFECKYKHSVSSLRFFYRPTIQMICKVFHKRLQCIEMMQTLVRFFWMAFEMSQFSRICPRLVVDDHLTVLVFATAATFQCQTKFVIDARDDLAFC